jgi:hypothetical protein
MTDIARVGGVRHRSLVGPGVGSVSVGGVQNGNGTGIESKRIPVTMVRSGKIRIMRMSSCSAPDHSDVGSARLRAGYRFKTTNYYVGRAEAPGPPGILSLSLRRRVGIVGIGTATGGRRHARAAGTREPDTTIIRPRGIPLIRKAGSLNLTSIFPYLF